jgi:lipoprotein-anchoring transpeptidase ErfK/SrfK
MIATAITTTMTNAPTGAAPTAIVTAGPTRSTSTMSLTPGAATAILLTMMSATKERTTKCALADRVRRSPLRHRRSQNFARVTSRARSSSINQTRKLYFIITYTTAYRYPISVGREGFSWAGVEKISRIAEWPDWYPPEEMRERDPKLPIKMMGGINNPLGAKAIYLGKTLYRIHGTNNPKSIGQAASSGCFRMMNAHVMHLAEHVEVGAEVHVLKHLPKTVATAN